jgi:HEPN domain-containing protein
MRYTGLLPAGDFEGMPLKPLAHRWLRQAEGDLEAARNSLEGRHYEWACFQAQQSAEKALKALLYQQGFTSMFTHSVADLVLEASKSFPEIGRVESEAKLLDTFYLATRYPNALASDRAPADYYSREEAERCLSSAESVLNVAKSYMQG